MAPRADDSPTDFVPPPPYQLSQEQFDRKTSHAIQVSSSIHQPIIDEDGWPIYDAGAFEAVAKSYEQSGSSSAGLPGADIPRHQRQASFASPPPPTDPMKTRSSDRRRRNHNPDREFTPERDSTPPPPFTPTGPSLDGPPFDEVVTISYHGPDPATQNRRTSLSPVTQPIAPGRSHRFSEPRMQQAPPNPYHSHRPASLQPDIPSRLNPASTITRVEFDPQMAYSPNGRNGSHTPIHQGGASAFYNHAVASQLTANPTTTTSPQTGYPPDRMSSPYASGYSAGTTYGRYQVTSPVVSHLTPDERYTTLPHGHRFSTPASLPSAMVSSNSLPSGAGYPQQPSGAIRGPLPPVPYSQWGGSEAQLVQDIYGGNG